MLFYLINETIIANFDMIKKQLNSMTNRFKDYRLSSIGKKDEEMLFRHGSIVNNSLIGVSVYTTVISVLDEYFCHAK